MKKRIDVAGVVSVACLALLFGLVVFQLWAALVDFRADRSKEVEEATKAAIVEEAEEPVVEPEVVPTYFDVPLDRDLQDHIFAECEKYDVDPALVVAMIQKESTFRVDAIGDSGNSLGLMQIQPRWHRERMDILGCDDLLDPYQNVTCGITIIDELLEKGRGLEWALMCYNGGAKYANEKVANGVVTEYVHKVYEYRDALTMVV